ELRDCLSIIIDRHEDPASIGEHASIRERVLRVERASRVLPCYPHGLEWNSLAAEPPDYLQFHQLEEGNGNGAVDDREVGLDHRRLAAVLAALLGSPRIAIPTDPTCHATGRESQKSGGLGAGVNAHPHQIAKDVAT